MSTILKPVRKLAGSSGFSGTLQASHQHNRRWLRAKLQLRRIFAKRLYQLVADDFYYLLPWRERGKYFLSNRFRLNAVDKVLDYLEVNVSLKQGQSNLFKRLGNVLFGKDGLSAKGLKGALEFFLKILEHNFESSILTAARSWQFSCCKSRPFGALRDRRPIGTRFTIIQSKSQRE